MSRKKKDKSPSSNNITRLLSNRKVAHSIHELPDDDKRSAIETATLLGVSPDVVYKTIVIIHPAPGRKPLLVMVPATAQVDLRVLAQSLGEKKLQLPAQREAERLTGLQAGGISPLALLNRGFEFFIDTHAQTHETIHVSGGQRNLNICLNPHDLCALLNARWVKAF